MNFLQSLGTLLGQHQKKLQAGQAATQQLGNNSPQAQQYAANPTAPQFRGVDPAQFGYPADNSGQQLQVAPNHYAANLGVPYGQLPQGNQYNPGFTPAQGSAGRRAFPQLQTRNPIPAQLNPQDEQQYWLQ